MIRKKLLVLCSVLLFSTIAFAAETVPMMDKDTLKNLLGSPDLIVLDARSGGDWSTSFKKIQGAVRASSKNYAQWKSTYPKDKTIVLYCS